MDERAALAMGLAELEGCWLELRCGSRVAGIPILMIGRTYGREQKLQHVISRLRCSQCGYHPESLILTNEITRKASGRERSTTAWEIDLSERLPKRCRPIGK